MKKILIGIDFAKEKFDVCAICATGVSITSEERRAPLANSKQGLRSLLAWARALCRKWHTDELLFCGEHTGCYSRLAADYIYGKGFDLWLANPLEVKRSNPLQRLKSDASDARMIAEYAMRHYDERRIYASPSQALSDLRELCSYRQGLVRQKMETAVRSAEKQRILAKSPTLAFIKKDAEQRIRQLRESIRQCDERIKELLIQDEELRETYEIVTSVPGVGVQTAATLIVQTDNFSKFGLDPRRMACYFGLAPFGRDSGSSVHASPRVSRFCNKGAKAALHEPALTATRHNPVLRAYYQRLLSRGKPKMLALNNVKSKLLHIIAALVRKRQKFSPAYAHPLALPA